MGGALRGGAVAALDTSIVTAKAYLKAGKPQLPPSGKMIDIHRQPRMPWQDPLQSGTQRLAAWCVLEADGQNFNFRFPDTRRLPGMLKALSAQQMAHFVGPVGTWQSMGRNGQWQVPLALERLPLLPATQPLDTRLTAAQFNAMLADGEADGILLALQDRGHTWNRPHSKVYAAIAQALHIADAAQALALDDAKRMDWCEACLADPALLATGPEAEPTPQKLQRWLENNRA